MTSSSPTSNTKPNSSTQVAKAIQCLWEYSQSIWEHRNGILHGTTIEEAKAKEAAALQSEITKAYEEYEVDNFIIPNHLRYLFTSRTLHHRLNQDIDSMICWLRSYNEAKSTQKQTTQRYTEAAKKFFQPRSKTQTTPPQEEPMGIQDLPPTQGTVSSSLLHSQSTDLSNSSLTRSNSYSSADESLTDLTSLLSITAERS